MIIADLISWPTTWSGFATALFVCLLFSSEIRFWMRTKLSGNEAQSVPPTPDAGTERSYLDLVAQLNTQHQQSIAQMKQLHAQETAEYHRLAEEALRLAKDSCKEQTPSLFSEKLRALTEKLDEIIVFPGSKHA